jgi:hypothetical protein
VDASSYESLAGMNHPASKKFTQLASRGAKSKHAGQLIAEAARVERAHPTLFPNNKLLSIAHSTERFERVQAKGYAFILLLASVKLATNTPESQWADRIPKLD